MYGFIGVSLFVFLEIKYENGSLFLLSVSEKRNWKSAKLNGFIFIDSCPQNWCIQRLPLPFAFGTTQKNWISSHFHSC